MMYNKNIHDLIKILIKTHVQTTITRIYNTWQWVSRNKSVRSEMLMHFRPEIFDAFMSETESFIAFFVCSGTKCSYKQLQEQNSITKLTFELISNTSTIIIMLIQCALLNSN